jgi:hypothetical protein
LIERIYETPSGIIHYWTNDAVKSYQSALVFLPGLTADHRLFEKQIEYFKDTYRVLVWDAPGHASSYPFRLDFTLFDLATWLDEIFIKERIENPIVIGQSMGGYVGQVYAQLFPEKLKGLVTIDSPSLQRKYYTAMELWLLKNMETIYRIYPWKFLLKSGPKSVSTKDYGRKLMYDMMMIYDGDQERYARLAGYGYKIFSEAVEKKLSYEVKCPQLAICGKEDRAGSCIRYLKAYERNTGKSVQWIDEAGHNSNADQPDIVNRLINEFLDNKIKEKLG